MELTYAEKKTIERALAILEAHEDERAKRFAIENEVKIDPIQCIIMALDLYERYEGTQH